MAAFQSNAFQNDAFQAPEPGEVPVGQAVEVDEAFPITPHFPGFIGQAVEVDEAFEITSSFLGHVGQAVEVDEALPILAETTLPGLAWRTPPRLRKENIDA